MCWETLFLIFCTNRKFCVSELNINKTLPSKSFLKLVCTRFLFFFYIKCEKYSFAWKFLYFCLLADLFTCNFRDFYMNLLIENPCIDCSYYTPLHELLKFTYWSGLINTNNKQTCEDCTLNALKLDDNIDNNCCNLLSITYAQVLLRCVFLQFV